MRTILLKDVRVSATHEPATDHIWFKETKGFQALGTLERGDVVMFDARVREYRKGYWGRNEERQMDCPPGYDYKLSHPTKIVRSSNYRVAEQPPLRSAPGGQA